MAAGARGGALKNLFKIDAEYAVGSEKHYTFCYLVDPFVDGPARSDFKSKKLSAMKRVFENQYGDEAIPLMCMILLDCGDSSSSVRLAKYAPSPFSGVRVKEERSRITYNLRCLFVNIASKLDSKLDDMIELLQEGLQNHESVGTKFQTVLLLLERAHQASIILPQKLTQLEEWLGDVERDDLIKSYLKQFDPNKQFPGHGQMQEASSPPPAAERQCSEKATGQNSTTIPDPTQPGRTLPKHPSIDSAYGEEDSRSRSSSHGDQSTLASYGSSDQSSKFRSDSIEEKGPKDVEVMVSGLKIK